MTMPRTYEDAIEEINFLRRELGLVREAERVSAFKNAWKLTPREAELVDVLYGRNGATASRQLLMDALYQGRDEPEIKILDVFIAKLRLKIGKPLIGTTWGMGYFLTDAGIAACKQAIATPAPVWDARRPCSRQGRREVPVAA